MRKFYCDYLVCVWDKDDRLYQQRRFEKLGSALSYATELIDKYQITDTIQIYFSKFKSIWEQCGNKERM